MQYKTEVQHTRNGLGAIGVAYRKNAAGTWVLIGNTSHCWLNPHARRMAVARHRAERLIARYHSEHFPQLPKTIHAH